MSVKQLELYGDSVLKGVTYDADSGRYRLCNADRFDPIICKGYELHNRSHMGATVSKGLSLLERKGNFEPETAVLLEYGGNDCDFDWDAVSADPNGVYLPRTPESDFLARYHRAVDTARKSGAKVAILSLVPIDAEKYFSFITKKRNADAILQWLGNVGTLARWQEYYNRLVERVARETGCSLIDLRDSFLQSRQFPTLLGEDGIHPTEAGHRLIGECLAEQIGVFL